MGYKYSTTSRWSQNSETMSVQDLPPFLFSCHLVIHIQNRRDTTAQILSRGKIDIDTHPLAYGKLSDVQQNPIGFVVCIRMGFKVFHFDWCLRCLTSIRAWVKLSIFRLDWCLILQYQASGKSSAAGFPISHSPVTGIIHCTKWSWPSERFMLMRDIRGAQYFPYGKE